MPDHIVPAVDSIMTMLLRTFCVDAPVRAMSDGASGSIFNSLTKWCAAAASSNAEGNEAVLEDDEDEDEDDEDGEDLDDDDFDDEDFLDDEDDLDDDEDDGELSDEDEVNIDDDRS